VAALERVKANLNRYRAAVLKVAVEGKLTAEWRAKHPDTESASKLLDRILKERRRKCEEAQLAKYAAAGREPPKGWKEKYREPARPATNDLPDLPKAWCWVTVEQLATFITKGSSPGWQGFEYTSDGVLFLRSQNVRWGTLDLSDVVYLPTEFNRTHENSIIRHGDVLLNLVGASIGRSAVATERIDGANTNQAVGIIRLGANGMHEKLLMFFFISPLVQAYIARSKADVARANFNLDDVRPTPIPLPPASEQSEIVAEVERRLSIVDELEGQVEVNLKRAGRLRQSILKRAFANQLVPQDPNDEPAAKLLERIRAERNVLDAAGREAGRNRRQPRPRRKRRIDLKPVAGSEVES
jgi:type I restriction enzyme S subunit